jgi:hypothetical protein
MREPLPDDYRDVFEVAAAEAHEPEALRADIRRYRSELDLPIDQGLEDWFVAEYYTAGRHPGGNWVTGAEDARIEHRIGLLEAGEPTLEQYIASHVSEYAGAWREWREGLPEQAVALTGDVEHHRRELARAYPQPALLRVVLARLPLTELEARVARVMTDDSRLRSEGVEVVSAGIDVPANQLDLEVMAPNEDHARLILVERYGEPIHVHYLGPRNKRVEAIPWQRWMTRGGPDLTVFYVTNAMNSTDRVDVHEDSDAIRVGVFEETAVGATALPAAVRQVHVDLDAPVGNRLVIDGATGRERPRRG